MIAILNKNLFPRWMDSVISFVVRIRFASILTTKIVVRIDTNKLVVFCFISIKKERVIGF
jgi:hypothetical protein